jgi:hypothetical protein
MVVVVVVQSKNDLIMMYIIINKLIQMNYLNVYLNQKQELKKIKHNNNNNNNHHHHQQEEDMEYGNKHFFLNKDLLLCIYCIEFALIKKNSQK